MAAWGEWIGSAPGHGGTAGAADGCSCAVLGLGAAAWHLGKLDLLARSKNKQWHEQLGLFGECDLGVITGAEGLALAFQDAGVPAETLGLSRWELLRHKHAR